MPSQLLRSWLGGEFEMQWQYPAELGYRLPLRPKAERVINVGSPAATVVEDAKDEKQDWR